MESLVLSFKKSPSLVKKWNKEFDVEELEDHVFKIVLVDDICDDNINDCLNGSNQLRYNLDHYIIIDCKLEYNELNEDIGQIILKEQVEKGITDDFSMKGVFLTTDSLYVIGYSINTYSLNISENIIFEEGLKFIEILEGGVNE